MYANPFDTLAENQVQPSHKEEQQAAKASSNVTAEVKPLVTVVTPGPAVETLEVTAGPRPASATKVTSGKKHAQNRYGKRRRNDIRKRKEPEQKPKPRINYDFNITKLMRDDTDEEDELRHEGISNGHTVRPAYPSLFSPCPDDIEFGFSTPGDEILARAAKRRAEAERHKEMVTMLKAGNGHRAPPAKPSLATKQQQVRKVHQAVDTFAAPEIRPKQVAQPVPQAPQQEIQLGFQVPKQKSGHDTMSPKRPPPHQNLEKPREPVKRIPTEAEIKAAKKEAQERALELKRIEERKLMRAFARRRHK